MTRSLSPKGLQFIKDHEGLRLEAYLDVAGIWTIGYGHTGSDVHEGDEITKNKAIQLLMSGLAWAEECVSDRVKVELNDDEYAALVSFCFNIGVKAFSDSTLLKRLNEGNRKTAADQFLVWDKITKGGNLVVSTGLHKRRVEERKLFQGRWEPEAKPEETMNA